MNEKSNLLFFIELKNFNSSKGTFNKVNGQITNWENIYHTCIWQRTSQNIWRTPTISNRQVIWSNWEKTWIDISPRKIYKWAIVHKKMVKINSHQRSANASHERYHFLPTAGEDKKLELSSWNFEHCWWSVGQFLTKLNIYLRI